MMEAVCSSESLMYFKETTQRYIPEGYHRHVTELLFKPACKIKAIILSMFIFIFKTQTKIMQIQSYFYQHITNNYHLRHM
jgi:hypothetical protein